MGQRDERAITGPNEDASIWNIAKVTNKRLHVIGDDPNQISHFVSHADLSVAPLLFKTSGDSPFKLISAVLRASQGITESIGIQIDSRDGISYDVTFASGDLIDDLDYYYPNGTSFKLDKVFQSGDQVLFTCSNKNNLGDVFLTLETENI